MRLPDPLFLGGPKKLEKRGRCDDKRRVVSKSRDVRRQTCARKSLQQRRRQSVVGAHFSRRAPKDLLGINPPSRGPLEVEGGRPQAESHYSALRRRGRLKGTSIGRSEWQDKVNAAP